MFQSIKQEVAGEVANEPMLLLAHPKALLKNSEVASCASIFIGIMQVFFSSLAAIQFNLSLSCILWLGFINFIIWALLFKYVDQFADLAYY
jgi:hypothetical protein